MKIFCLLRRIVIFGALIVEGNAIWKIFIDGEVLTTPVVNSKKAYVRLANYEILQIDLKQGDIDWRYIHSTPS